MNSIDLSPREVQAALVDCLGNESPALVEIGDYNASAIIHKLKERKKENRIVNNNSLRKALVFLKSFLNES